MKNWIAVICIALAACSNPHDKIIPADLSKWQDEMKPVMEKLKPEERDALAKYMMRHMVGNALSAAFGGKENGPGPIPPGMTVGKAIAEQQAFEAEQQAFEAEQQRKEAEAKALKEKIERERAALQKQISDAITVTFIKKEAVSDRYNINDRLSVTFGFENKSDTDIAGIKGEAVFTDVFGDKISTNGISYDKTIKAGSTATWTGSISNFDTGYRKLRDVEPEKLKFDFVPEQIVFADGRKLAAPASRD